MQDISHKEIYDRLAGVELKVDTLGQDTKDIISAFHAAQGAFAVLEWLAKVAKPLLWIAGIIAATTALISQHK
jgi:hypothetical protein